MNVQHNNDRLVESCNLKTRKKVSKKKKKESSNIYSDDDGGDT